MKKLLLFFLLVCHFQLFARDGFFVQPIIGAGFTNATVATSSSTPLGNMAKPSCKSQFLFGYKLNNIVFKTGLSYFNAGYLFTAILAGTETGSFKSPAYRSDNYLALPVSIGYDIKLTNNLSITPYLGYFLGFAQNRTTIFTASEYKSMSWPEKGTSSFASVQLEVNYRLSSKFYLTASPEAQYMFPTRFDNDTKYFSNYTYTLNLGVKYFVSKRHKCVMPVVEPDAPRTVNENITPNEMNK